MNPLIKSNNLLNNALAMQEAFRRGALRRRDAELHAASWPSARTSNLFIVKDGAALTPPLDAGLLPGITREFLFEVGADAGIPVREAVLRDADLFGADEAFLTSTTREVVPIVQVDDRTIGAGTPGPDHARAARGLSPEGRGAHEPAGRRRVGMKELACMSQIPTSEFLILTPVRPPLGRQARRSSRPSS